VRIEGAGEVSQGEIIELPEDVGAALFEQQPGQWALEGAGPADSSVFEPGGAPPDSRVDPAGGV